MKIYLAGLHTYPWLVFEKIINWDGDIFLKHGEKGVQKKYIGEDIENFWLGGESRHWIHESLISPTKENDMKVYLAGPLQFYEGLTTELINGGTGECFLKNGNLKARETYQNKNDAYNKTYHPYILESFYYVNETTEKLIPLLGDFMLDSGAFTFIQNSKEQINWDEYIEKYADFVKRNKIKKFFELDIDSVVGYEKVKKMRNELEKMAGSRSIPVWHKNRGIDEYYRLCEEYDYIAIGGYVIKELKPKDFHAFPHMIKYAHDHNAKVHCLGFTRLSDLSKYHFDSVDSTAWTTGNRFGFVYHFDGKTMRKTNCPNGKRLADPRRVALNNYTEWIKFQRYAEEHL